MSTQVVGHRIQRTALSRLIKQDRLPSALLLCGPAGVGKKLVAIELARLLLCSAPKSTADCIISCDDCEFCVFTRTNSHPDLYFLDAQSKNEADVGSLRDLLYNLNLKSFYGRKRIVIIDNADKLNTQGANLLLKSLEEPRPETYFLLVATNRYSLPSTLLSRCQSWFFDTLSNEEIEVVLLRLGYSEKTKELAALTEGSLENLEQLANNKDQWHSFDRSLKQIIGGNLSEATQLANELARDKEGLRSNLAVLRICVRQLMLLENRAPQKTLLAVCLTNLIHADYLIFQRYLAPLGVLASTLCSLHCDQNSLPFSVQPSNATLLSQLTT